MTTTKLWLRQLCQQCWNAMTLLWVMWWGIWKWDGDLDQHCGKWWVITPVCQCQTLETIYASSQSRTQLKPYYLLLSFTISWSWRGFPFFFFILNSGFRQKEIASYVEFKKAHATGMSSCPWANSWANPKHQTFKSKLRSSFLQPPICEQAWIKHAYPSHGLSEATVVV